MSLGSTAEDVFPRRMRLDVSTLATRDEPGAQARRTSANFAAQVFYLLIGGMLPIVGVLWIMAHSP